MNARPSNHRQPRGSRIAFAAFWQSLLFCLILFLGHRATIFSLLTAGLADMTMLHAIQCALVGVASDLWIGSLMATVAMVAALVLPARIFRWAQWSTFLAMTLLLAAHHSYVEFYRTPVLVFHMRYLLDPQFIASSQTTVLSPMVGANLGIGLVAFICALRARDKILKLPPATKGLLGGSLAITGFLLFALAAHAFQIRYRVQWFVPGTLQFHTLEKLVIDYFRGIDIPPPHDSERRAYEALTNSAMKTGSNDEAAVQLRESLRRLFTEALASGKKPVFAIMALETFRPSEIDIYANSGDKNREDGAASALTPHFNQLASNGILFLEAFSTGTVTCSGQEALWCGYQSGLYTSLMRVRADLRVDCLPAQIRPLGGLPMWIHNGEAKFDNQASFWRKHGVDAIVSQEDFPPQTPGSSWGLSDLALAERSAQEIDLARKKADIKFVVPFILTVTNHIPWELPGDAPRWIQDINAPAGQNTRMWRTTAYTDAAIGRFVEAAKASGFWDQMILVLASDHGNKEMSRHGTRDDHLANVESKNLDSAARLQSHIALLLSGGMVERALAAGKPKPASGMTIKRTVGQTGVARLARYVTTGKENPGEPDILLWPSQIPVISDLNEAIYLPKIDREIPRDQLKKDWSEKTSKANSQSDEEAAFAVFHFKVLSQHP
ncbi:MAG: hypothetical protein RIQ81_792 [Pseudomonadota bacterium]